MPAVSTSPEPLPPSLAAPPWPGSARPFLHPDRLALLGALHGLPTVDVTRARVLELGAGDGASLLPLAAAWPEASWVGVEADPARALPLAERVIELGLGNVMVVQATVEALAEAPARLGLFDYVLAHGLLSRLSVAGGLALWRLLDAVLAPDGVALVSFDTWPGQHATEPLRRLLAFHVAPVEDPAERVEQARSMARWHVKRWSEVHGETRTLIMQRQLQELDQMTDDEVARELLDGEHRPFLLEDIVAEAARHGLQWLTNARPTEPRLGRAPPAIRTMLAEMSDIVRQQQYLDYFLESRFRTSLFCRAGREVRRQAHVDDFAPLWVSARPGLDPEPRLSAEARWLLEHTLAGLDGVAQAGELVDRAIGEGFGRDRMTGLAALAELFFAEQIELARVSPPVTRAAPTSDSFPRATAFARFQARGELIHATSLWHREVPLLGVERQVLVRCDGTRAADEIVEAVGPDAGDALEALHRHGLLLAPGAARSAS